MAKDTRSIVVPANSRIRAKIATPGNNGETLTISILYHTY
jgi:hypothetical protein